jgi:arginine:pyruvate transaminase
MKSSNRVDRIAGKGSQAWKVHRDALEMRQHGRNVIMLTVGDPDQSTPEVLIEGAIGALRAGETGYAPILGFDDVRDAIAARFASTTGRPCHRSNVSVVPGAQAGLFCALQCLVEEGDEVIVPEPTYATYEGVLGSAGGKMIHVPLRPERGFHPDIETIAAAITPRTRAVWINSPHNPTGAVMSAEEIAAICALCTEHDLWLISDEVYDTLAYSARHVSPWSLPGMSERTIVISSLSKSHAAPGMRFGWVIGPQELTDHMANLILCMFYGAPRFIQRAAFAALTNEPPLVTEMKKVYARRAALMSAMLSAAPLCRVSSPQAGMFIMLDVRNTGMNADAFAEKLLVHREVAVLSCEGFGPSASGHLRISLTAPDELLGEAARRIVAFATSISASEDAVDAMSSL